MQYRVEKEKKRKQGGSSQPEDRERTVLALVPSMSEDRTVLALVLSRSEHREENCFGFSSLWEFCAVSLSHPEGTQPVLHNRLHKATHLIWASFWQNKTKTQEYIFYSNP